MTKYRIIFYYLENTHLLELCDNENRRTPLYKSLDGQICRYVFDSPEQAKESINREIIAAKQIGVQFNNGPFYYSIEPVELNLIESTL